jgi:hypothetical protein
MQETQLSIFDYQALDVETRIVVQQRTDEIKTLMRRTAQDIIDIGNKLIEVKARIGHGNFGKWLDAEFGWSDRTARNFMSVGEAFKTATVADLNIAPKALYLLASPSTPDSARAIAFSRAESGEKVTHSWAKALIEEHALSWGDRVRSEEGIGAIVELGKKYASIELETSGERKSFLLNSLERYCGESHPYLGLETADEIFVNGEPALFLYPIGLNHSMVYFQEETSKGDRTAHTHQIYNAEIQKQLSCLTSLTSVADTESASLLPLSLPEESNSVESPRTTHSVASFSENDTLESKTSETSQNSTGWSTNGQSVPELTSLPVPPPVLPSLSKGNDSEPTTPATVSPVSSESSKSSSPTISPSKTSPESFPVPSEKDTSQEVISENSSIALPRSGLMLNGKLFLPENSGLPSFEKDYYWLPSPGALSAPDGTNKAGQSRLEGWLKEAGILESKEVLNPNYLEKALSLPLGWTNPSESRPATELLETVDKPWGIALIRESPDAPSIKSSTSTSFAFDDPIIQEFAKGLEAMGERSREKMREIGKRLSIESSTSTNSESKESFAETIGENYSVEHYTPKKVLDLVIDCLGTIDLDPCSNREPYNVPATTHYTETENGLNQPWTGKVFLNPPYGRVIDDWVSKLVSEFVAGAVTEAIALVPARTDTRWFDRFYGHTVCFWRGRLTFINNEGPAKFPSAIFYLGENETRFAQTFQPYGSIYKRLTLSPRDKE